MTTSDSKGDRRLRGFIPTLFPESPPTPRLMGVYLLGFFATTLLGEVSAQWLGSVKVNIPLWPIGLLMLPALCIVGWPVAFAAGGITYLLWAHREMLPFSLAVPLALVSFAIAFVLYRAERRRAARHVPAFHEGEPAPFSDGLLWILGPGDSANVRYAIEYHRSGGGGKHVWVIAQTGLAPVKANADDLVSWAGNLTPSTKVHIKPVSSASAQDVYDATREVYYTDCIKSGLTSASLVADITSGTKLMATGMILAAMESGCGLESVRADYVTTESEGKKVSRPKPVGVESIVATFDVSKVD